MLDPKTEILIVGMIIGGIISYIIMKFLFLREGQTLRKKSVQQSRNSILGEVSEKVLPLLPEFPYHTKDMIFIGKGIDYIILKWISRGEIEEIIFLEIKSGKSGLNRNERSLKEAISRKKVRYEIIRIEY